MGWELRLAYGHPMLAETLAERGVSAKCVGRAAARVERAQVEVGDLLITFCTSDRNTPFGQSMRMLVAFTEAGKDVEMLVLPGQGAFGDSVDNLRRQQLERPLLEAVAAGLPSQAPLLWKR